MSSRYSLIPTKEGYNFTTDSGLTYCLYFTSYYLKDSNGDDIKVMSFGFYHEPHKISNRKYDGKIKNTILHAILEFFQRNPEIGLLFFCDTCDGYGRHRKITFNKWHKEANAPIEKFDCHETYNKEGFYTSILVRSDSPLKDYYVSAFYATIDEFFPDIDQSVTSYVAILQ